MRFNSVVLPLPRKPVRMVTGTMFSCCMSAPGEERNSTAGRRLLRAQQQKPFQVVALGELQRHRMVGGRAEPLDDLRLDARVERRAREDRLKQLARDATRAREASEQSSGREQLESQQVDVLVG